MLTAWSTPGDRIRTCCFLTLCVALAVAAGVVGISDHPPGIALAYGASTALVLAFVHPWRAARPFLWLLLFAVVGFFVTAFVHNVAEVVADRVPAVPAALLRGISVAGFLVAVLLCPPAAVVGVIGFLAMAVRNRRRTEAPGGG